MCVCVSVCVCVCVCVQRELYCSSVRAQNQGHSQRYVNCGEAIVGALQNTRHTSDDWYSQNIINFVANTSVLTSVVM